MRQSAPALLVDESPVAPRPAAKPPVVNAGILARAERFGRAVSRVIDPAIDPLGTIVEEIFSPVEALVRGRRTLLFGTNSYLGLNFHPECIEAAVQATRLHGTGSTASRVAGGNTREHVQLEAELAEFYGREHAVVFSTGFVANLGLISSLAGHGDAIFLDAHCHASIVDAAKLAGATIRFFEHNSSHSLEKLFRETSIAPSRVMVVVEGVYSVLGDISHLGEILTVAKCRGAVTVVDEAHSLGVYGATGRGAVEHCDTDALADIIVGTFSKSVGVVGGFSVSRLPQLRSLKVMARPFLYTASLPPGIIAAARASLAIIRKDDQLKMRLWRNVDALRSGLAKIGVRLSGAGPIGIIPVDRSTGYRLWESLLEQGVYVNMLIPPATPNGELALRLSVSAAHTQENIDHAVQAFAALKISESIHNPR